MNAYQMFGLRRLSQLLRSLPPEKFNMKRWFSGNNGNNIDLHACGTSGCIGGWSTLFFDDLNLVATSTTHADLLYQDPDHSCKRGFGAVAAAWGVTFNEAENLCHSTRIYDSPAHAADAVDELIEKYFIKD